MNKLEAIKKVLRKHGKEQTNLQSEDSRKIVAIEIMEAINDDKS